MQLLLGRYAEGYAALVFNLDRQNYLDFLLASFIFCYRDSLLLLAAVLGIRDILVRIGSVPLTNESGSDSFLQRL